MLLALPPRPHSPPPHSPHSPTAASSCRSSSRNCLHPPSPAASSFRCTRLRTHRHSTRHPPVRRL
ncbi:hypothetical protein PC116_g18719 [Phytophthora cactorum]|nr:hypothetical protein PC128_g17249 [Phytophthora cactorum]KAG4233071.1 hypothetical protein PC116_g18719 [Phytophthora cactorum]